MVFVLILSVFMLGSAVSGKEWTVSPRGILGVFLKQEAIQPASHFFTAAYKPRELGTGVFLVAAASLLDPHFRETVVLIIRHGPHGTFGVIINRPTDIPLASVWPEFEDLKKIKGNLFSGGPVQPDGFGLLFTNHPVSDDLPPVFDQVFFTQKFKKLRELVSEPSLPKSDFRVYAGNAGWAPGQLQGELQRGSWIIVRGVSEAVFAQDPRAIWSELIERSKQEWVGPGPSKINEGLWAGQYKHLFILDNYVFRLPV